MNTNQGNKKPQLEDIAAALGLSKSTVSRAISGKGRIRAETRERVFECIKELNYRPNMIAKSLSEQKTYNIGVVIPMDSSEAEAPFFQTCLTGIAKQCAGSDYNALVIGTERDDLAQLTNVIENRKVDGVIVTRPAADGSIEKLLDSRGMPFVVIGKSVHENSVIVDSDHVNGCRELTSYIMMSTPPERIGLILGSTEYTVNKSRYTGFMTAMLDKGFHANNRIVFTGIDSELKLSKAVSRLTEEAGCILCGDDMLCMSLLTKLSELGLSVPQDIKVASFYDSVYLSRYSPPVTSLIFNAAELGAAASSQLLKILDGQASDENVMLGFEIMIRRSTM